LEREKEPEESSLLQNGNSDQYITMTYKFRPDRRPMSARESAKSATGEDKYDGN